MNRRARSLAALFAGLAAAFTVTAGTAQAAPDPDVFILSAPQGPCQAAGDNGVNGGVFADYDCNPILVNYGLFVEPTYGSFDDVYIATLVDEPACEAVGDNGVNEGVWSDYQCVVGTVPSGYLLLVSN
ncbi:hypothetical protein AB0I60_18810 [Actinosynnema sp. NPDC050436]|uniref:hypothetical protein n=1 Tax=Actinosynnema sp. NPDC050436 TaxID=3155659 RepID=UPI003411A6D8